MSESPKLPISLKFKLWIPHSHSIRSPPPSLPDIGEGEEPLVEGDHSVPPVVLPVRQLQLQEVRVRVHRVHPAIKGYVAGLREWNKVFFSVKEIHFLLLQETRTCWPARWSCAGVRRGRPCPRAGAAASRCRRPSARCPWGSGQRTACSRSGGSRTFLQNRWVNVQIRQRRSISVLLFNIILVPSFSENCSLHKTVRQSGLCQIHEVSVLQLPLWHVELDGPNFYQEKD